MRDYVLYSGGARGADALFSVLLDEVGAEGRVFHIRPEGNESVAPSLKKLGIQPYVCNKELLRQASEEMFKLGLANLGGALQCRNYYQVVKSGCVVAVAEIEAEDWSSVNGGTNTAVQLGIKLNLPVYVLDIVDANWYSFRYPSEDKESGVFVEMPEDFVPDIPRKFTGVGTRRVEDYNICKNGEWIPSPGFVGKEQLSILREKLKMALKINFIDKE